MAEPRLLHLEEDLYPSITVTSFGVPVRTRGQLRTLLLRIRELTCSWYERPPPSFQMTHLEEVLWVHIKQGKKKIPRSFKWLTQGLTQLVNGRKRTRIWQHPASILLEEENGDHGFYGLMLPPALPSFSSPLAHLQSPEPGPRNHNKALRLLCASRLLSDHTRPIWPPSAKGNHLWSCVDLCPVLMILWDTQEAQRSMPCTLLNANKSGPAVLLDDTALRLMCSHVHILCSRKKCEHPRSRSGPHWKRKYGNASTEG